MGWRRCSRAPTGWVCAPTTLPPPTSPSSSKSLRSKTVHLKGTYVSPLFISSLPLPRLSLTFIYRFIFWKTLNDAQTKIRGKFAPNGNGGDLDIDIEEYEAIKGEEEVFFFSISFSSSFFLYSSSFYILFSHFSFYLVLLSSNVIHLSWSYQ